MLRYFGGSKGPGSPSSTRRSATGWSGWASSAWVDKKIDALSKGMAQKVQFIATVLNRPELLILDEPFTGLDPVNTEVLKDAVLDLRKAGTTVVFSTHDMAVAERLCDRIFMIFKGRKVLDGTLDQTFRPPTGWIRSCVRSPGGSSALADLPGVEAINDYGQLQEGRLTGDPQTFSSSPSSSSAGVHRHRRCVQRPQGCAEHDDARHAPADAASADVVLRRTVAGQHDVVDAIDDFDVAPFLMLMRIAVPPGPPMWQVLMLVSITALTVVAAVYAAGRIFRTGLLMQGKAATVAEMWRWVRDVLNAECRMQKR